MKVQTNTFSTFNKPSCTSPCTLLTMTEIKSSQTNISENKVLFHEDSYLEAEANGETIDESRFALEHCENEQKHEQVTNVDENVNAMKSPIKGKKVTIELPKMLINEDSETSNQLKKTKKVDKLVNKENLKTISTEKNCEESIVPNTYVPCVEVAVI